MSDRILITGGAGFIGSNLVEHFLHQTNYSIINLDALTYAGHRASLDGFKKNPRHTFIKGNILNNALVTTLLDQHKPIAIIHLAAQTHVDRSIDHPMSFIETNVLGTATLLECALKYWGKLKSAKKDKFKFIHISTDEVFGSVSEPLLFNLKTPYNPHSPYSASKAAADHLVRAYHSTYGLPTLISNCCNNYGPRQHPEKLIPHALNKILANAAIPLYGDGQNVRDWIYVLDHFRAIEKMLQSGIPGKTYLVSAMQTMTNKQCLNILAESLKAFKPELKWHQRKEKLKPVTDRPGHDRRYALDSRQTQSDLDWIPLETFASGINKTLAWYLNNSKWCEQILKKGYKFERFGKK